MPMCFNLFGELHDDPDRAARTANLLLPGLGASSTKVVFEWSPGRRDPRYTGDRTAFDVALLGSTAGGRAVIGVETKYHEHALRERPAADEREARYRAIADASGVFKAGWEDAVLPTPLRQVWRDHLLLLAMLSRSDEWARGRYVLVYPQRNVSFARVAAAYREVLRDDSTFLAITVEELLDLDVLHHPPTAAAFRERYLW
jgi:hypothetical protein